MKDAGGLTVEFCVLQSHSPCSLLFGYRLERIVPFPGGSTHCHKASAQWGSLGTVDRQLSQRRFRLFHDVQTQRTPGHSGLSSLKWHLVRVDNQL